MKHIPRRHALLLCLAFIAGGCRSESEPAGVAGSTEQGAESNKPDAAQIDLPAPSSQLPASAAKPEAKSTPTPDLANPKVTTAQVAAFAPPFPDRLDLFEPPKGAAENAVKRDDEHGETVELKGFINVDQPRVILSIDGVVSPIPEGGEKYGVHVIAIQPPGVVLQRGRNRWTATLE